MRKEPFAINDFVHVYNRGNRKQEIVRDEKDRKHFLQMLYYFNTEITPDNPIKSLRTLKLKSDFNFVWPEIWQPRKPIVEVYAFALMNNHYHLLLREIREGGITLFMRRLGTSMTNRFNLKYRDSGRLFQGAYKARRVATDEYLSYLSVYIQVKNPFELYFQKKKIKTAGIQKQSDFNEAFEWASHYPYCSLAHYTTEKKVNIIQEDLFKYFIDEDISKDYKKFAQKCLYGFDLTEQLGTLSID